ncbi:beta-1,6-galactofuranosyltransferase [Lactobacillus sp. UCMA15818]|uniref:beta-1,6-galactofuranosyltransferase n=1 Tax=Lactobacillus sp. UCMA15818 TaxID=2583394 RepID=UPI0025B27C29|nr:beta-1,6-galactofuranosyltransferase [Lactobacillus sp. UCMA15818]MDN2452933.1 beta-1,6-galactofuranosyltransferase [Lactobacillus sp. UCMA15818]
MVNYVVTSRDPGKMGGSKAKEDIIKYLKQENYESFKVNPYQPNKFSKLLYTHFKMMKFFKNKKIQNLIMQYPIPSQYMIEKFVSKLKKNQTGKFIIWIHDIQGLQNNVKLKKVKWEIKLFNQADILIVHNEKMRIWLVNQKVTVPMIVLGIFDYDNPQAIQKLHSYEKTICFAGALFKSTFLTKVKTKNKLYTFGPDMPKQHSKNIIYGGQYSPEELSRHLTQNFGLIWDGPEVTTCAGTYGHYLLFNNPHKTSLYISSGIPIIIWKQAALADFVIKNKIGITINNLSELDNALDKVTPYDYQLMKANVDEIAKKIRAGYYTKQVVEKINKI